MKDTKVAFSKGCVLFLCAYGIIDPWGSFWPFVLSVLFHECSHILCLTAIDKQIIEINGSLGGFLIRTGSMSYGQELLTAAVGPGANLLLLSFAVGRNPAVALINGILFAYNMLPFYPLDGGRILRAALRLTLPLGISDGLEKVVAIGTISILFVGAVYLSVRLHSGIWPMIFWIILFLRVGKTLFSNVNNNSQ